jgi:hypothetical protein
LQSDRDFGLFLQRVYEKVGRSSLVNGPFEVTDLLVDLVLEVFLLQEVGVVVDELLGVYLNEPLDVDAVVLVYYLITEPVHHLQVEEQLLKGLVVALKSGLIGVSLPLLGLRRFLLSGC